MANRTAIRIGVILDKPLSEPCAFRPRCQSRGLAFDAALITCELLHLTCIFELFDSYDYGNLDNSGNVTGIVRAVQDGRYDTTLPFITGTYDRFQAVHLSTGVFYMDNVLVTRMPKEKREVQLDWNIINSFDWPVWCAFMITFACAMAVMVAIEHTRRWEWKMGVRPTIPFDFENRRRRYDRLSDRFVYMAFSLLEFTFCCTYSGIMYSNQVATKESLPFTDLDTFIDCLVAHNCHLIAPTLSYSSYELLLAQGGPRLNAALEERPPMIVDMKRIPSKVAETQGVYLTWLIPKMFFSSLTRNNRDCKFYHVTVPFSDVNTYPVRKDDWHLRDMLDSAAGLLQQHGITSALESKYGVNVDLCDRLKDAAPERTMRVLTVRSIYAALAFYACGIAGSILLLGMEKLLRRLLLRFWGGGFANNKKGSDNVSRDPNVNRSAEVSAVVHL